MHPFESHSHYAQETSGLWYSYLLLKRTIFLFVGKTGQCLQKPSLAYSLFICHYQADEYLFRTQNFYSTQDTKCLKIMREKSNDVSQYWQAMNLWYTVHQSRKHPCTHPSIYSMQ